MTGVLLAVAGAALLVAVFVWRRQARNGPAWWTENVFHRRAVLCVMPGIALALLTAGPVATYDRGDGLQIWAALPFFAGLILTTWGWLGLPVPRWYLPRWLKEHS